MQLPSSHLSRTIRVAWLASLVAPRSHWANIVSRHFFHQRQQRGKVRFWHGKGHSKCWRDGFAGVRMGSGRGQGGSRMGSGCGQDGVMMGYDGSRCRDLEVTMRHDVTRYLSAVWPLVCQGESRQAGTLRALFHFQKSGHDSHPRESLTDDSEQPRPATHTAGISPRACPATCQMRPSKSAASKMLGWSGMASKRVTDSIQIFKKVNSQEPSSRRRSRERSFGG